MSNHAIQLGNAQVEFEALHGPLIESGKMTQREAISELLRSSARKDLPFKCYDYLESFILNKYFSREQ